MTGNKIVIKLNPYNPYIANKMIRKSKYIVFQYIDDNEISPKSL